jgi:hypothetical protein
MEAGKSLAAHHLSYQCWQIDKMPGSILSPSAKERCRITGFSTGMETIKCLHGNQAFISDTHRAASACIPGSRT